ncbi:MAG: hypothetical protein ACK57B_08110, partial [Betaproteobacteria bacterium]
GGPPAGAASVRVAGGSGVPAVADTGVALAGPGLPLQPGRDHTLLLAGTPAAPRVVLLTDDNTLPRDTARARLRLVNALADASLVAAMTLDFAPVGGEVAAGDASAPALVEATSTGRIAVTARGATAPLLVATEQVVRAGGVHTVFVAGAAAAAVGILRRDR